MMRASAAANYSIMIEYFNGEFRMIFSGVINPELIEATQTATDKAFFWDFLFAPTSPPNRGQESHHGF
jgi:hypothetical protein